MDKLLHYASLENNSNDNLFNFIQEAATIGTWEYYAENSKIVWSDVTKKIHEVSLEYEPDIENALAFYKKGTNYDIIKNRFEAAVEKAQGFDEELQIITKKRNEKWVRAIGYPVFENGKCIKVYGLFQDITDKTNAARKIALREEQFRASFNNAAAGMSIINLKGQWTKINISLCKMLGYDTDCDKLIKLPRCSVLHPSDLKKDKTIFKDLLTNKIKDFQGEKRYINKDGETLWFLVSISLIRNDVGEPIHFLANKINITKSKKSEKEINSLLKTTKKQNERLLNFAHIVSHNLRSHSSNFMLLLEMMNEEFPDISSNPYYPLLKIASDNLNETISNLNKVAAIKNTSDASYSRVNLYNLVEKNIGNISNKIIENDIEIKNAVEKNKYISVIPAYADSIVFNLISNAIKYRNPDIKNKILISSEEDDNYTILNIKDNGLGINLKKNKDKIFGMYKTFHRNDDAKGLGLFLSKNQIESMNGKIKVKSNVNKGSTFSIYFKNG